MMGEEVWRVEWEDKEGEVVELSLQVWVVP